MNRYDRVDLVGGINAKEARRHCFAGPDDLVIGLPDGCLIVDETGKITLRPDVSGRITRDLIAISYFIEASRRKG